MKHLLFISILFLSTYSMISPLQSHSEHCLTLNQLLQCEECEPHYILDEEQNQCIHINSTNSTNSTNVSLLEEESKSEGSRFQSSDLNCKQAKENGQCAQCYLTYYYSLLKKRCIPVNQLCKTWNQLGHCKSCYPGYKLAGIYCFTSDIVEQQNTESTQIQRDPNCRRYQGKYCVECSYRYYFNDEGVCLLVHPDCRTWDDQGKCTSCYAGFQLGERFCWQKQNIPKKQAAKSDDPNCKESAETGICQQCQFRHYFNEQGFCVPVSNLCKTWEEENGDCTSCYGGFVRRKGRCVQKDPYCIEEDDDGCTACAARYFVNDEGICELVDAFCSDYNPIGGKCNQCYVGYQVNEGKCKANS